MNVQVATKTKLQEWAEKFFSEKVLPFKVWTIESEGLSHVIDSDFITNLIINETPDSELAEIKNIIVRIDFHNGDINHFLGHLAKAYIWTNY
jgi:hypothetical protein